MKSSLASGNTRPQNLVPTDIENLDKGALSRPAELHPGDLCPRCQEGRLDYDGLLNLGCPKCGYTLMGCFT